MLQEGLETIGRRHVPAAPSSESAVYENRLAGDEGAGVRSEEQAGAHQLGGVPRSAHWGPSHDPWRTRLIAPVSGVDWGHHEAGGNGVRANTVMCQLDGHSLRQLAEGRLRRAEQRDILQPDGSVHGANVHNRSTVPLIDHHPCRGLRELVAANEVDLPDVVEQRTWHVEHW